MTLTIPILIEELTGHGSEVVFDVRPVFHPTIRERGPKLARVLNRLNAAVQKHLSEISKAPRHDDLAAWTSAPSLQETTLELRIELKSTSALRRFVLMGWAALGRMLYFTPSLPLEVFEVGHGQSLEERATQVITSHLRAQEKAGISIDLNAVALQGKVRLASMEVSIEPSSKIQVAKKSKFALLFGDEEEEPMDGATELSRIGHRLNDLYPEDLDRAVGRNTEVAELLRLFSAGDRRSILLVGPRKVGKTALIHEAIRRLEAARRQPRESSSSNSSQRLAANRSVVSPEEFDSVPRVIWQVAPMRLISGMSVLGQWENRVLAILDHIASRDAILYVDDLMGLFSAGISATSDLNVAAVLKPFLEKRLVRVLGEMTHEALRVFRERDRALADLFQVLPVHESSVRDTWKVLIAFSRDLESQHRCEMSPEVVPITVDLHRRFVRDAAFPGKAAGFLRRLATRAAGGRVGRNETLDEFRQQSGLRLALLDARTGLTRREVVEALGREIAGQPSVLEAFADIVSVLKARLNDPARPLATFLLLGPTGVGKTQSAKALSTFLFGSNQRLLRFDMNEYVHASAVTRLVGTPREPDGLLTSALRRQPFSVVLFDEIEKAAPEVFDLLLGVLDEGRLTDSLGRVADFTNAVILLTSNLGVREARHTPGFHTEVVPIEDTYRGAAEKFFRPEFFNRLDRVIAFQSLERSHLEQIANTLISGVFSRQGLRQRECLLEVTPAAIARLVELGHHPQLGARALKRVVERELAQPLAERLVAIPPGAPTRLEFHFDGDAFRLKLQPLLPASRTAFWSDHIPLWAQRSSAGGKTPAELLDAIRDRLDALENRINATAPTGRIDLAQLSSEQAHAIFCREQMKKVDVLLGQAEAALTRSSKKPLRVLNTSRPRSLYLHLERRFDVGDPRPDALRATEALRFELQEIQEPDEASELPDSPLASLLRELALLEVMIEGPANATSFALVFQGIPSDEAHGPIQCVEVYRKILEDCWGYSVQPIWPQLATSADTLLYTIVEGSPAQRIQGLIVRGPGARQLLQPQLGFHLQRLSNGRLRLVRLQLLEIPSAEAARVALEGLASRTESSDLMAPLIRFSTEGKGSVDYRSGLRLPPEPTSEEWRAALLSALPLPW